MTARSSWHSPFLGAALAVAGAVSVQAMPPPPVEVQSLSLSPRLPSTQDTVTLRIVGIAHNSCASYFAPQPLDGNTILLTSGFFPFDPCPNVWSLPQTVTLGPFGPGDYLVILEAGGEVVAQETLQVRSVATALSLRRAQFGATLNWSYPDGRPGGEASAVQLTDEAGYFWFFDTGNVEVTVKLLDGRPINGHFWVFVANTTNMPFTLQIMDRGFVCTAVPCPNVRTYVNPAGENLNFLDVNAFPD